MNPHDELTKTLPVTGPTLAPQAAAQTVASPRGRNLWRLQIAVGMTIVFLAIFIGLRLWSIRGLWRAARIDGPSMAPTLCGAHYRVNCYDCGFAFLCDAENRPADDKATCPNCGFTSNLLNRAELRPAERMWVDRWPLIFRSPQRQELVAMREPAAPQNELIVKRTIGLPAETISIQAGDVFIAGQPLRKTRSQWLEVQQLVHDNNFQPRKTTGLPPRWQPQSKASGWRAEGTRFRFENSSLAAVSDAPLLDRLVYHHWRCTAGLGERTASVPIRDNDSYNQSLSRELVLVHDLAVSCRVRAGSDARLAIQLLDGSHRLEAKLDFNTGQATLWTTRVAEQARFDPSAFRSRGEEVEFALCDQQAWLTIGGRVLMRHAYDRPDRSGPPELHPISLGAAGGAINVSDLKVGRDIHYLEPGGTTRAWQASEPTAEASVFLLGDNPPVSIDSRHWPPAGVHETQIIGRVYRPFWAARAPADVH